MKRKLSAIILGLLLCFNMVMPVAATGPHTSFFEDFLQSGTTRPPASGSESFTLTYGETTKQMAYVDQFYNHDGSFSTLGDQLLTWLNMTPTEKADDPARNNSGYLMLEQEMQYQKSFGYWVSDSYIRLTRGAGDILSLNFLVDMLSKDEFEKKFPGAGQDAYIYYTLLFETLIQYVAALQVSMDEASDTLNQIAQGTDNISTIALQPEISGAAEKAVTALFSRIGLTNAFIVDMKGSGSPINIHVTKVLDSKSMNYTMEWIFDGRAHKETGLARDVMARYANSKQKIIMNFSKLPTNVQGIAATDFEAGIKKMSVVTSKSPTMRGLNAVHVKGCFESVDEMADELGLTREYRRTLKQTKGVLNLPTKKQINIPQKLETLGKVANAADIVTSFYNYAENKENLTVQQLCYHNAITQVTEEYLTMLSEWESAVQESSLSRGDKEALMTAIAAVWKEGMDIHNTTAADLEKVMQKMTEEEVKLFASKSRYEAWKSVLTSDWVKDLAIKAWNKVSPGIMKAVGPLVTKITSAMANKATAATAKGAATTAKTSAITITGKLSFGTFNALVSFGSLVLNGVTNRFVGFGDRTEAIYNMKASLYVYLTNEKNGLLHRYARRRTHETACLIIEALNTMKQLKIRGEDIIEEYYLADFYDHHHVKASGQVHAVFFNEIVQRNGDLDVSEYVTPIYGVYQLGNNTDKQYKFTTLGYYLMNNSDKVSFNGITLKRLPTHFSQCKISERPYSNETSHTPGEQWLNNQIVTTSSEYVLLSKRMLYSRDGVDVVLSPEEYDQLLELQKAYNSMDKIYGDTSTIDWDEWEKNHSKKEGEQQQYYERLRWIKITRTWIEKIKMFDIEATYPVY